MEQKVNEAIFKNYGLYIALLGLVTMCSLILTNYLITFLDENILFILNINHSKITLFFVSAIFIIEGIIIYKNSFVIHKSNSVKNILKRLIPYIFLLFYGIAYIVTPEEMVFLLKNHFYISVFINIFPVFIILFELKRGLNAIWLIIKNNVQSEELLSVVIAIFATIISAIALFK